MGGGYNIQQHPPSAVQGDTELGTHKLNAKMMINSHRISNPQEMGYPCNGDKVSPNSQNSGDAFEPA